MKVIFFGSAPSRIFGVVDFLSFGQTAELPDKLAKEAVLGGCAIAPADTVGELVAAGSVIEKFSHFGMHGQAPAEFHAVRLLGLAAVEKFRAACEAPAEEESVNG